MSAKIAHHPTHPPITQIAEDARRRLGPCARAMVAVRIATRDDSPHHTVLLELFEVSCGTFYSARTVLQHGSDEEIRLAAENDLPLSAVAREIRKGIPPSERSRTKPRNSTRRGKLSATVHAQLADEYGNRKRLRTRPLATVRPAKPAKGPVEEPPTEPMADLTPHALILEHPPVEPVEPPFLPIPALPPPATMCLAVDILIKASREMTPEAAAVELGRQLGIDYAQMTFSNLVLWMVDVNDVIDRMAARVRK